MARANLRWDEFKNLDQSVLIVNESITVPSTGDPYVRLQERPKPGSLIVYDVGDKTAAEASDGTYVYQGMPGADYSTSGTTKLEIGRDDAGTYHSYIYRSYLKFPISALPASAGKVLLWLFVQSAHAASVNVHRVLAEWTGAVTNWGNQPRFDLVPESSSASIAQQPAWYSWDITELYNNWKSGAYENHGVCLRTDEITTDTVGDWTGLHGSSLQQPHIDVIGSGVPFEEVDINIPPGPREFASSSLTARLRFHPSRAGHGYTADYMGMGSPITVENA